jgi:ribosomal protein S18 acetylase RimI-like enzyme
LEKRYVGRLGSFQVLHPGPESSTISRCDLLLVISGASPYHFVNSMNVSVRTARPEDLVVLAQLLDEVVALHHNEDPSLFRGPEEAQHTRYLEERFQDPDAGVFIAEDQRVPAGVAITVIRDAPPFLNPSRFVLLENLAVAAKFRRTGVGRKLVDAAILWTRARDMHELDLNVYEFNHSAIRFYEAIGFRTVSRRMKRTLAPLVETKH